MTDTSTRTVKIVGRILLDFEIKALTGLHIGGAPGTLAIGNVDNPVIRNPFTNEPYIPGSSLRGKMRSQLEKEYGATLYPLGARDASGNSGDKKVYIHTVFDATGYQDSVICQIFGVPAADFLSAPTRLIVRDAALSSQTKIAFNELRMDQPYTEVKWEAAIDRVTSAAVPRQQERVPAGAVFVGALTFTLYNDANRDATLFDAVIRGLELVEEDYLGGQGARGSGQVRFENLKLRAQKDGEEIERKQPNSLSELKHVWNELRNIFGR